MEMGMPKTIHFRTRSRASRFVAIDRAHKGRLIAEGKTALAVHKKAEKIGIAYIMAFVPPKGKKYVF
jgi:hypothetical protein